MQSFRIVRTVMAAVVCCVGPISLNAADGSERTEPRMPSVIEQFTADRISLTRSYTIPISSVRMERFQKFYEDELAKLAAMNFDPMSLEDKIDYLLLKNRLTSDLHQLAIQKKQVEEMEPLLPFAKTIEDLVDCQRRMLPPDGEKAASALTEMVRQMNARRKELDPNPRKEHSESTGEKPETAANGKRKINPVVANRAVNATRQLAEQLRAWFGQYNGYDPTFTWWVAQPYKDADKALTAYSDFLKEKLIGIAPDDKTTIIGDPVGRDALMNELAEAYIPYSPV